MLGVRFYRSGPHPEVAMPLQDHFHPPLNRKCQWRSLFSALSVMTAAQLNLKWLPKPYVAVPHPKFLDVVECEPPEDVSESPEGWPVPRPAAVAAADFANGPVIEVEIR